MSDNLGFIIFVDSIPLGTYSFFISVCVHCKLLFGIIKQLLTGYSGNSKFIYYTPPPANIVWGYIGIGLSVCLSVRPSVCRSVLTSFHIFFPISTKLCGI